MKLNIQNVEELIFYNRQIKKILPEFFDFFKQWEFAIKNPGLSSLAKRTALELLDKLDNSHLDILSNYFGEKVTTSKLDHQLVSHHSFLVEDAEIELNKLNSWIGQFAIHRNKNQVYISRWR